MGEWAAGIAAECAECKHPQKALAHHMLARNPAHNPVRLLPVACTTHTGFAPRAA